MKFKIVLSVMLLAASLVYAQDSIPKVGTFFLQSLGGIDSGIPYPIDPYAGAEPIETINASQHIYVGVDPNAQDAAGDGWSNYQKFLLGIDPNIFITPPAPQLSLAYDNLNGTINLNWLPSPGPVNGYMLLIHPAHAFCAELSQNKTKVAFSGALQ